MKSYPNELVALQDGIEVIAYDLDGTLAQADHIVPDKDIFPDGDLPIGDPKTDVWDILIHDKSMGRYIIIFTVRLNNRLWNQHQVQTQESIIMAWLNKYDFIRYVDLIIGDKPLATRYIDDRAVMLSSLKKAY